MVVTCHFQKYLLNALLIVHQCENSSNYQRENIPGNVPCMHLTFKNKFQNITQPFGNRNCCSVFSFSFQVWLSFCIFILDPIFLCEPHSGEQPYFILGFWKIYWEIYWDILAFICFIRVPTLPNHVQSQFFIYTK